MKTLYKLSVEKNTISFGEPCQQEGYIRLPDNFDYNHDIVHLPLHCVGIVVPVLKRVADINKLYSKMVTHQNQLYPDIYYQGSFEQSQELARHFGVKQLTNRGDGKRVRVYASGANPQDNQAHLFDDKHHYTPRWIETNDHTIRFLEAYELMDSIFILLTNDVTTLRALSPDTQIYRGITIHGDDFLQVCVKSPAFYQQVLRLLEYRKATEYYYIHAGALPQASISYFDDSSRTKVGHIPFIALGAYRKKYDELFRKLQ